MENLRDVEACVLYTFMVGYFYKIISLDGYRGGPLREPLTLEYKTQKGGELCSCLIFANNQLD